MYLDILIVLIFILSILDGIKSGFLVQFFNIFGIIIDFIVTKKLTPIVMEKLELTSTNDNYLIMYIVVFFLVYIAIAILLFFIGIILKNQNKGFLSKGLGGIVGAVKGTLICMILLFVINSIGQKYIKLNKYINESKINDIYLNKIEYIDSYVPKQIKNEINRIRSKNIIGKYF